MSESQQNDSQNNNGQTIIINQNSNSNGVGTAGFVLSIVALIIGCIPILGWFVWFLGLVLSFIGVFKKPRTLAMIGLFISLIGIILLLFVFANLALFGASSAALDGF
ncbi:hypothetical protein [uncultured Maribacter sp.]|uniref:hypothetical protein n=1 Tax=uncultured Maribacter sp. TaxID=431308 RepID=UPI00262ACFC5|nr:hypothetical protein [uncultured Maribacter sp.]